MNQSILSDYIKEKKPEPIIEDKPKVLIDKKPELEEDLLTYEGLGAEIKSKNGIVGLHEARKKNLGQFFTSLKGGKFIIDLLQIPKKSTVLDSSCGTGRLAWHLKNKKLFTGIEIEEKAYEIAKKLYPDSCIIQDDFTNHDINEAFDYVLLNPPFSLNLKCLYGSFKHLSYGGGILSQVAALEQGIRAVKKGGYFAVIVPSNIWKLETSRKIHQYIKEEAHEVARIKLPKDTFVTTDWGCSLLIFKRKKQWENEKEIFVYDLDSYDNTEILEKFKKTEHYKDIKEYAKEQDSKEPVILEKFEIPETHLPKIKPQTIPHDKNKPIVEISIVSGKLHFTPNNVIAALKIQNVKADFGKEYDYSLKEYVKEVDKELNSEQIWTKEIQIKDLKIVGLCKRYGLEIKFKQAALNWLEKKKRYYEREIIPFEQWVKPTEKSKWEECNKEEGIRNQLPEFYKQKEAIFDSYKNNFPHFNTLYGFQKDDIIRASLKNRAILAIQQGLGKTRIAISLAILKGCKRNLFVVPSHLIKTWEDEFKELEISYHIIREKKDIDNLDKFNLISYNTLKKKYDKEKTRWGRLGNSVKSIDLSKTFAHKLKKRFKFVSIDESHYCSNKQTAQTRAVKILKPKYLYQLTGTPIGNTVKNIYSLLEIGWKPKGVFFPFTTKQFREEFVSVEWVTPEFEDTLSSGRTAQQMAEVKNPEEFMKLMDPKWIRRVKEEPKVKADIIIPKPIIHQIECIPKKEQLQHYKKHLKDFAVIFKQFMHPEQDSEHKVNQSIVLAQIQNLQYCASIPQHEKVNPSEYFKYNGGLTTAQEKTIELIREHNKKDEKIIIFTQRKDYCNMLKKWLLKYKIKSAIFNGTININKRNEIIDDFKFNGMNVLIATINVTDTGLNIPQANVAIFIEADWKYSKIEQAYSRLLRPQTKKQPTIYLMKNKGTIDEYLWQHCYAKKGAIEEVLDRKEDVQKEEWQHWTDFIINMLKNEGLWEK